MNPAVTVIIAVRNAAPYIVETLTSLSAQTFQNWAAIVIDDGSTDATAEIVSEFAIKEHRISLTRRAGQGVSAARNAGIDATQSEWLLFLDGDDTIHPRHLESLLSFAQTHPRVGAVHCGWKRIYDSLRTSEDEFCVDRHDMFEELASRSCFAIHACLIRRSAVIAAGSFDESMACCEDWDLWQKIARLGTKFGHVHEVLSYIRVRTDSVSSNIEQLLHAGLTVIRRGHEQSRTPATSLPAAELLYLFWCAGVVLGRGQDARELLRAMTPHDPGPSWFYLAETLIHSVLFGATSTAQELLPIWRKNKDHIEAFLETITTTIPGIAIGLRTSLAELVLESTAPSARERLYHIETVPLELTDPLFDLQLDKDIDRVSFRIFWRGTLLGSVTLPAVQGKISKVVIADAIAAKFAWSILEKFFGDTIYRSQQQHDAQGWDTFLQEIWGTPHLSGDDFYRLSGIDAPSSTCRFQTIEIGEIGIPIPGVPAIVTLAGRPLGIVPASLARQANTPDDWRSVMNLWSGFELCRTAVRDLIIGKNVHAGTLSNRLKRKLTERKSNDTDRGHQLILGRRQPSICGAPSSRYASLPASTMGDLQLLAARHQELVNAPGWPPFQPSIVEYSPEVLQEGCDDVEAHSPQPSSIDAPVSTRAQFEALFSRGEDPWGYTNEYEQVKYEQTISLLSGLKIKRALELACAEGHFTIRLAPLVDQLIATDISEIAVGRAGTRCSEFSNIQFRQFDYAIDELPAPLDLIVCSEALYYAGSRQQLDQVARRIAGALHDDGYFLSAHANQLIDAPNETGFDWGHQFGAKSIEDSFRNIAGLQLVREIKTPLYRIQLFQKSSSIRISTTTEGTMGQIPDHVATSIRWNGGQPTHHRRSGTHELPILMYHSISPFPGTAMRVTVEDFERQMAFLKSSGYRTVTLKQWRDAMLTRQPLPGNAVILTFDDGYLDFYEHAWPILKKYDFSALVFIVTGLVGGISSWSGADHSPLMSWNQIRELQKDGAMFGAHTHSHRSLRRISLNEAAKEMSHSRLRLEDELSSAVRSFAYPYGDKDECIEHLAGGCGYDCALGVYDARAKLTDNLLNLSRLNIDGRASFDHFASRIWGNALD